MQSTVLSDTCQAQALKHAICMAGAHVDRETKLEEQCYTATRSYLDQAELEVQGSSFWNLEAAQALVLVARYEFTHIKSQRAFITMARLNALISILQQRCLAGESPNLALSHAPTLNLCTQQEMQRTVCLVLSLKCRSSPVVPTHDEAESYLVCAAPCTPVWMSPTSPSSLSDAYETI